MRVERFGHVMIVLACVLLSGCGQRGRENADTFASALQLDDLVADSLPDVVLDHVSGEETGGTAVDVATFGRLWTIQSDRAIGAELLDRVVNAITARVGEHGGDAYEIVQLEEFAYTEAFQGDDPEVRAKRIMYRFQRARGSIECRLIVFGTDRTSAYLSVEHMQFRPRTLAD